MHCQEMKPQLATQFIDPNLEQLEYQKIQKMTWDPSKETLQKFFTWFKIFAGHANYIGSDQELIHFIEEKIPQYYLK